MVVGAREREGGPRRVDAVEGGGRRVVDGFGGALKSGTLGVGFEREGFSAMDRPSLFFSIFEARGGSIEPLSGLSAACD